MQKLRVLRNHTRRGFCWFCENCNHSYDNQFESRTDISVVGAIESHCLPELVLPNYITDAEFIIIQRIFIDELKNIKKIPQHRHLCQH